MILTAAATSWADEEDPGTTRGWAGGPTAHIHGGAATMGSTTQTGPYEWKGVSQSMTEWSLHYNNPPSLVPPSFICDQKVIRKSFSHSFSSITLCLSVVSELHVLSSWFCSGSASPSTRFVVVCSRIPNYSHPSHYYCIMLRTCLVTFAYRHSYTYMLLFRTYLIVFVLLV